MANESGKDFTLEKSLPSNVEAERMILGVILLDNLTVNQAVEILKPDDFFLPSHRRIFEKMVKLYEQGQAIDPLILQEELRRAAELDQVGGPAYIASLFDGVPRFSNIESYTRIVKGKSLLRKLIGASNQIMQTAFDDEDEPEQVLDRAERLILSIAEDRIKQGFTHIADVAEHQLHVIEEVAARQQLVTGIATGFTDLDYMTSGLQRGDLIIVAARPSMGKCLAADAEILLAGGEVTTIENVYRRQQAELLTLGDDFKFKPSAPSAFVDDGVKPVYRLTTRLGRQVDSTLPHPFLTINGWRRLSELNVGDRIAVPRRLAVFGCEQMPAGKVKVLAYLIGDGNLTNTNPSFTNTNPRLQQDFIESLNDFMGLKIRSRQDGKRAPAFYVAGDAEFIKVERDAFAARLTALVPHGQARSLAMRLGIAPSLLSLWRKGECVPSPYVFEKLCDDLHVAAGELMPDGIARIRSHGRNSLTVWLEELGLRNCNSHEKFVPSAVFTLERSQLALFLNRLFATDGWVAITNEQNPAIGYSTVSERLARQVQHLLLRFGIIAKLRKKLVKYANTRRESWQLDITHGDAIRAFAEHIGIFGKEEKLAQALKLLSSETMRNNRDLIPVEVWDDIELSKGEESWASLARRAGLKSDTNIHVGKRSLSRMRLLKLAQALNDDHLADLAQSDVYWDEIVSIEYQGEKQVYDLTIPETHNFVANDVCVHNTAFSLNIAQNAALGQDSSGRVHEDRKKAVVGVF
ncbi:MAG TPA: DnaB-like helicase N-terminal domain-containing protein, partial [Blastocatellia bacterium]|nr:DnaB-like helicase N-terminal domain-containing protein [Blastocatellia bacterium]